jgi:hypothetical protein
MHSISSELRIEGKLCLGEATSKKAWKNKKAI